MTLTVAQPLIPVFHPASKVSYPNRAILDLEKQNECISCQADFEPNETTIVGHHTGVQGVWHATHKDCLRNWCLSKVPPSTKMVPCTVCQTPLNVRSLFPRNSIREWVRILKDASPKLLASAIGAAYMYGLLVLGCKLGFALGNIINTPTHHWTMATTPLSAAYALSVAYSVAMMTFEQVFLKILIAGGDTNAIFLGSLAAFSSRFARDGHRYRDYSLVARLSLLCNFLTPKQEMIRALVAPIVAAMIALIRHLKN